MTQQHNTYDRATRTTISEYGVRRQNRHRSEISVLRFSRIKQVFESHTACPMAYLKTIFFWREVKTKFNVNIRLHNR